MFKRLLLALVFAAGLLSPALGAGTISLSLSQQFDSLGKPLNGGKLYFLQAGTTSTPQNAYQDSALTIPWPNPLTLDAAGRVPQLHFADGNIKIRLTNAAGVTQVVADNILVVGASSGGGGGGTVDATTVLATGDLKVRYGTGSLSGFVRANGRTIGSATSGSTERANADAQALFEYLWAADANLAVSTGRGASANADWVANKTIALPDGRGRTLASLDDMGASAAGTFTGSTFTSGDAITLGSRLGVGTPRTMLRSDIPNVAPTFTGSTSTISATFTSTPTQGALNTSVPGAGNFTGGPFATQGVAGTVSGTVVPLGTVQSLNGGVTQTTFPTISPFLLVTTYIKL